MSNYTVVPLKAHIGCRVSRFDDAEKVATYLMYKHLKDYAIIKESADKVRLCPVDHYIEDMLMVSREAYDQFVYDLKCI